MNPSSICSLTMLFLHAFVFLTRPRRVGFPSGKFVTRNIEIRILNIEY